MLEEPQSLLGRFLFGTVLTVFYWAVIIAVLWAGVWLWHFIFGKKRRVVDNAEGRRLLGVMKRLTRPTILLTPTKDEVFTKLGGAPELPSGMEWPQDHKAPRAFLAHIDLAEVRQASGPDWLPPSGRIYAFLDEDRYGFADTVRILFTGEALGSGRIAPAGLPPKMKFGERRCGLLRLPSKPSLDWLGVDLAELDIDDEMLDELSDAPDQPFGDELQHRIGGYPSEIQSAQMALECEHLARGIELHHGEPVAPAIERASKQWRLLLQIDSDPALKMNWGDAGRLYVFIRQRHAEAGDFSKTVTIFQTH